MRILFITTSYPSRKYPAAGTFVHMLAQSLKKIGHEVHVITPADEEKSGVEVLQGIEVHRVWYAPKRLRILAQRPGGVPAVLKAKPYVVLMLPLLFLCMAMKIARLQHTCDILHGHWMIASLLIWLGNGGYLRKPFVLTCRQHEFEMIPSAFIKRFFIDKCLLRASYIVAVSESLTNIMRRIVHDNNKCIPVSTIPNGVDEIFFRAEYTDNYKETINILYIGSIIPRKRVDVLVKSCKIAIEKGCRLQLTIVGDGTDKLKIVKLIEEYALGAVVKIDNPVEPSMIPMMMQHCHCLALFSASEGRPNVVIEAMAAGRAILATNLPGVQELLGDSGGGYLAPVDDIDALAHLIITACRHPERLRHMGERARQRIRQLGLSWETTARAYEQIYHSITR
jgi:glycosyltransferase involved in cell wall biosynthesis